MSDDPTRAVSEMLAGIFGYIDTALEEEGMPLSAEQRAFLFRAADRSMTPWSAVARLERPAARHGQPPRSTRPAHPTADRPRKRTERRIAMTDLDLMRDAAVLARHWCQSRGMTYGSPDVCSCGTKTHPVASDDEIDVRRARAFAGHQAEMLAAARLEAAR